LKIRLPLFEIVLFHLLQIDGDENSHICDQSYIVTKHNNLLSEEFHEDAQLSEYL